MPYVVCVLSEAQTPFVPNADLFYLATTQQLPPNWSTPQTIKVSAQATPVGPTAVSTPYYRSIVIIIFATQAFWQR